jgi:hypothetical protein
LNGGVEDDELFGSSIISNFLFMELNGLGRIAIGDIDLLVENVRRVGEGLTHGNRVLWRLKLLKRKFLKN